MTTADTQHTHTWPPQTHNTHSHDHRRPTTHTHMTTADTQHTLTWLAKHISNTQMSTHKNTSTHTHTQVGSSSVSSYRNMLGCSEVQSATAAVAYDCLITLY